MKDKYRIVYQPRGAALEYSPLAANLYKGCPHACRYCYAPSCLRREKEVFHASYGPRINVIDMLQKDMIDMVAERDHRTTLLCFTCDPYPGDYDDNIVTQWALELFKAYNRPVQVLTKGGMKASRDFHLYKKSDSYAVTLTLYDPVASLEWEPKAALPEDRIKSLRKAKEKGIHTWVSFEPVIDPEQVYKLYDKTKDFVDLYKIGKLNHYVNDTDWREFGLKIIEMCERDGKEYMIKDALQKFIK